MKMIPLKQTIERFNMNRRKYRTISTLFLALLCTLSIGLTAWAASGEGSGAAEDAGAASKVITCGAGEATESTETVGVNPGAEAAASEKQGASLGLFTTTGYCNCERCSGGHNLTYSGTVPKANHTLSADLDLFPLGTKLMINGTVYTVEDMGSNVDGNKVDIYYGSHEEAVAHGMKQEEVFMVE